MVTFGSHLYTHYNVRNLPDPVLKDEYQKNAAALSKFRGYLPIFAFPFGQPGACFSMDQAGFLLKQGAVRLFTGWSRPNLDQSAKIIDRIALSGGHDSDQRMWFQVLKYPILETLGRPGLTYDPVADGVDH